MANANLDQLLALIANRSKPKGFDQNYLADENIDPSVRADSGNMAMQGELRNRIFQAERSQPPVPRTGLPQSPNATSPFEVDALRGLLGSYQDERNDPQTPLNQQATEVAGQRKLNLGAMNEGFQGGGRSPIQEREIYKRGIAEEQMRQPLMERNIVESGLDRRQGRQIEGTLANTELQSAHLKPYYEAMGGYYDRLGTGNVDPNQVRSIGRNGITFQTPQRDPNANVMPVQRDLARAEPGSDDYNQSMRTLVTQSFRHDPELGNNFVEWLSDPDALPFNEAFVAESPEDQKDILELRRLATLFGKP